MSAFDYDFAGARWTLAVFSSRESATQLTDVIAAAANAERGGAALEIDVLVNGNPELANELRARLATAGWWRSGTSVRLWSVSAPDKAYTWNQYLHGIAPDADLAFFMDGYVTVAPEAFAEMALALRNRRSALAATSMPSRGRSAGTVRRQMLAEGGLHGNLYALTGATMRRLRDAGFRLPRGIYRNDSALGAALAFDLDPARNVFSWDRIAVVPDARYDTPATDPTRLADIATVLKRRWRQARGQLETCALKAHLAGDKRPPSAWPATARALVLQWADAHPDDARALLWTDPAAWAALVNLRNAGDDAAGNGPIECLGQYSRASAANGLAVTAR